MASNFATSLIGYTESGLNTLGGSRQTTIDFTVPLIFPDVVSAIFKLFTDVAELRQEDEFSALVDMTYETLGADLSSQDVISFTFSGVSTPGNTLSLSIVGEDGNGFNYMPALLPTTVDSASIAFDLSEAAAFTDLSAVASISWTLISDDGADIIMTSISACASDAIVPVPAGFLLLASGALGVIVVRNRA